MASSKVVCWNSGGIRASAHTTEKKIAFFDNQFPMANFSIAAFVETHHKSEEDFPDEIKEYGVSHHILHTPTDTTETHGGIIVLITKEYNIISSKELITGRFINIKCVHKITKKERNISVFYGPIWHKMNKDNILRILENFKNVHSVTDNNLILGDFNFIDNHIDKGKKMDQKDKMIHPYWDNFKTHSGVTDPYRMQYPPQKKVIPMHHRKVRAGAIEHILVRMMQNQLHK